MPTKHTDRPTALRIAIQQIMRSKRAGSLSTFVTIRRGQGQSWDSIARELGGLTRVDITGRTLAAWFPDTD